MELLHTSKEKNYFPSQGGDLLKINERPSTFLKFRIFEGKAILPALILKDEGKNPGDITDEEAKQAERLREAIERDEKEKAGTPNWKHGDDITDLGGEEE